MAGGAAVPASALQVGQRHFEAAMRRVAPSVSRKDQRVYDQLRRSLRSTRGHLDATVRVSSRLMLTSLAVDQMNTPGVGVAQVPRPLELTEVEPGDGVAVSETDIGDTPEGVGPLVGPNPGAARATRPEGSIDGVDC